MNRPQRDILLALPWLEAHPSWTDYFVRMMQLQPRHEDGYVHLTLEMLAHMDGYLGRRCEPFCHSGGPEIPPRGSTALLRAPECPNIRSVRP